MWSANCVGLVAIILVCLNLSNAIRYVTVTTGVGEIEGFQDAVMIDGSMFHVDKFLGVPYGEPATGVNRFDKPVPKAPFQMKYSALSFPPSCYQPVETKQIMSEDCLYLNIYVPKTAQQTPLPVMVWIHGGAFVVGAASEYQAEALSGFGQVVVVTINYRLGVFGFLRSTDGLLIGNQGLWDQHLALKWVNNNIAGFNGSPNDVTIFGESAGSASVLMQSLYPGNTGLFKRVIAESGAALSYWAVTDPKAEIVEEIAGCSNASDPVFCLRLLTPGDLLKNAQTYKGKTIQYTPNADHDFLTESPKDIIYGNNSISSKSRAFFASLDILTGTNSVDGALYFRDVWAAVLREQFPNIHLNMSVFLKVVVPLTVQTVLRPKCHKVTEQLESAVAFEYTDWTDPNNDTRTGEMLLDLSNDIAFFVPAVNTVQGHSMLDRGKTYFYEFALDLHEHVIPTPTNVSGSNHADELPFVFGYPVSNALITNVTFTDQQKAVSRAMMAMWTNFAKSSDPNKPFNVESYIGTVWPQYNKTSQDYLQFTETSNTKKVKQSFQARRMAFWLNYIPTILNTPCL